MALTRAEMDRRLDEHFGYEAKDDIAGVLATMAVIELVDRDPAAKGAEDRARHEAEAKTAAEAAPAPAA